MVFQVFHGGFQFGSCQLLAFFQKILDPAKDCIASDKKGAGADTSMPLDQIGISLYDFQLIDRNLKLFGKDLKVGSRNPLPHRLSS